MENTKELIEKSFEMGYEAFPKLDSAPYLNVEFMRISSKNVILEMMTGVQITHLFI